MSTTITITPDTAVGEIAVDYPLATRVFARHNIDFCCGGGKPLGEVCNKLGLDTDAVLKELHHELASDDITQQRWDEAPLGDLIDHILATYHRPLDEELPRLEAMLRKVNSVHGEKDPERLTELLRVFVELKDELTSHMSKEEQVLFPMIKSGNGAMAMGPVNVMIDEHESAGDALKRIRVLTDDFQPREDACTTWRALWHGLGVLETAMHEHIHLENNILFPRALGG